MTALDQDHEIFKIWDRTRTKKILKISEVRGSLTALLLKKKILKNSFSLSSLKIFDFSDLLKSEFYS